MKDSVYRDILETLVDMVDVGIHVVDEQGITLFYNSTMADIEQLQREEVIGVNFRETFPNLTESTIDHALQEGATNQNRLQRYANSHGKSIVTMTSTMPVLEDGRPVAAVEVASDITHLSDLNDKLISLQRATSAGKEPQKHSIKQYQFHDLIGESPLFLQCLDYAKLAAKHDISVFIYGETGTGKELISQSIHYGGSRGQKPFLAQNCGALPSTLLESILFGTTKGSYTGAVDRPGLFEQADGGTLLLDELNSMPYELQSKLLRTLQESYVRRVGGTKDIPVDVRIIATVNEPPQMLMEQGLLRRDLYHRLNVINLEIPPLRDRVLDIECLTHFFLEKYNKKLQKNVTSLSGTAWDLLLQYHYPGNVRELENIIHQAMFLANGETLTEQMVKIPKGSPRPQASSLPSADSLPPLQQPLTDYLEDLEKTIIQQALIKYKGNISQCAQELGMRRQTLQHKLKKYNILFDKLFVLGTEE